LVQLYYEAVINEQEHCTVQNVENETGVQATSPQLHCTFLLVHSAQSLNQISVLEVAFAVMRRYLLSLGRHF